MMVVIAASGVGLKMFLRDGLFPKRCAAANLRKSLNTSGLDPAANFTTASVELCAMTVNGLRSKGLKTVVSADVQLRRLEK